MSCCEYYSKNLFLLLAAFLTQTVSLDDCTVKFEIWDTAGQERYRSLAPMYYRGAAAAIVVYDITNPDSFIGAKSWVKELQRRGDPNVVIALVSLSALSYMLFFTLSSESSVYSYVLSMLSTLFCQGWKQSRLGN